jgi:SAM-dependent methyltransferase
MPNQEIIYLSQPSSVSMADDWFDVANLDHFWIKRRFEIFRQLLRRVDLNLQNLKVAEIGCGNGLVQYQFSKYYGIHVDGFDLNEVALQKSVAIDQNLFLYDIHERNPEYKNNYDLIILFDVIEHIGDPIQFVDSVLYHLKKGGILAVNVPALQALYSDYDLAAGHIRRYNMNSIKLLENNFSLNKLIVTYWGLPLLPILIIRKLILVLSKNKKQTINSGFKPSSNFVNHCLYHLSQLELIPQSISGTSLMLLYRYQ